MKQPNNPLEYKVVTDPLITINLHGAINIYIGFPKQGSLSSCNHMSVRFNTVLKVSRLTRNAHSINNH